MALSYRQVSDLYDTLKSAGVVQESLSDWSTMQNRKRGNNSFDAGVNDNWIKQASTGIDRALEWTGLPDIGEGFGRSVGTAVGRPEEGANIGRSLPRMFVDFAPLFIPGAGAGFTAARLAGTAALSGAGAYTETGSPAVGVVAGATNAAMPAVYQKSLRTALGMFGDSAGKLAGPMLNPAGRLSAVMGEAVNPAIANRIMPLTRTQGAVSLGAGEVGASIFGEVGAMAQSAVDPNSEYHFDPITAALDMTLGQLPFAGLMLTKTGRAEFGGRTSKKEFLDTKAIIAKTELALKLGAEKRKVAENTPGTVPLETITVDLASSLEELRGQRRTRTESKGEGVSLEEANRQADEEYQRMQDLNVATGGKNVVGGAFVHKNSKQFDVFGTEHGTNKNGTFRIVEVKDLRGQDLRYSDGTKIEVGDLVGFPTGSEPGSNREAGQTNFFVPRDAAVRMSDNPLYKVKKEKSPDNFQELPVQSKDAQRTEQIKSGKEILDGVEKEIATAMTPEQFEAGIFKINALREHYGMAPLDNAAVAERRKWLDAESASLEAPTDKEAVQSLINETRKEVTKAEQEQSTFEDAMQFMGENEVNSRDPTHLQQEEHKFLLDLQNTFLELGGDGNSNYQKIINSGMFHRKADFALRNGELATNEGREAFKASFVSAILQGEGLSKKGDITFTLPKDEIVKQTTEENFEELRMLADQVGMREELDAALAGGTLKAVQDVVRKMNKKQEEGETYGWQDGQDDSEGRAYGDGQVRPSPGRVTAGITGRLIKRGKESAPYGLQRIDVEAEGVTILLKTEPATEVLELLKAHGLDWPKIRELVADDLDDGSGQRVNVEPLPNETTREWFSRTNLDFESLDSRPKVFDEVAGYEKAQGESSIEILQKEIYNVVKNPSPVAARSPEKPWTPTAPKDVKLVSSVGNSGKSQLEHLLQSEHPVIQELAADLHAMKLDGALDLIEIKWSKNEESGMSFAVQADGKRVIINLAENLSKMSELSRQSIMVHELFHGLTLHELANPAKAEHRNALEMLRKEVIGKVSPELRAIVEAAEKSNWYERYAKEEAGMAELTTNTDLVDSAYALLNGDEFVSQTFSSKEFRDILTKIKVDKNNGLQAFKNWVGFILGFKNTEGSAFDEVMNITSNVLNTTKSVASVRAFGLDYFSKQGLDAGSAGGYSDRLVGLLAAKDASKADILNTIFEHKEVTPGMRVAQEFVTKAYEENGPDKEFFNWSLEEAGYEQSPAGFETFIKDMLLGDGKNIKDWMDVMPDAMKPLLYERANDAAVMLKALNAFDDKGVMQWLNVESMDGLKSGIAEALDATHTIMQANAYGKIAYEQMQGLAGLDPVGAAEIYSTKPSLFWTKEEMGSLAKFIMKPAQAILNHPLLAEGVDKGYQLMTNSRHMQLAGHAAFAIDLDAGVPTDKAVDTMFKTIGSPRVVRAVDGWIFANQQEGQKTGKIVTLPITSPQVQELLKGLSKGDRESVQQLTVQKELSQQKMNLVTLDGMRKVSVSNAAALIADTSGFKLNRNVEIADAVMEYALTDFSDPQKAAMANQKMQQLSLEVKPEILQTLIKVLTNESAKWRNWDTFMRDNPGWASAQRMGDYTATFANGKMDKFDSKAEAELRAKQTGTTLQSFTKVTANMDFAPHFGSGTESWIAQMRVYDKNMQDMMVAKFGPEILETMQKTSAVEQFAVVAKQAGIVDVPTKARTLRKGAEDLSYLKNHFSWIGKTSTYWARQIYQAEMRLVLMDPELQSRPDLKSYLKQHAENILSPDPKVARMATRFTTHWLLGANVASAMANGTQMFLRGAGQLTALTANPLRSYKMIASAGKEVMSGKWNTAEHEWLRQQATHDGEIGLTIYDVEEATNEVLSNNIKRHIAGQGKKTAGDHASTLLGGLQTGSMWMFRQVEHFNNSVALLVAFDHHRNQGMSKEQAYIEAKRFNHAVNDVGGKVNRSVGAFSGQDTFSKSTAMIANSMQSYVIGSIGQLTHLIGKGFFNPPGFTPHEKYAAKVAAVQMLAVQFAMAGTLGMPFMAGGIALLEKLFPNLQLNKNLRELLAQFFGEDEESGHTFSDAATTGLPSLLGWDWQSRLSMGTLPGVSEYNGFQVDQLIGAPLSVATGLFKGATKLAQGDASGVRDLMPPAFKKIFELTQSGGGPLIDSRGNPTIQPTPGEQLGMLAGFQPKRKADFNAAQRIAVRADKVANQKVATFRQDQAQLAIEGKFGNVQATLRAQLQENPELDVRGEIQAIARQAESLAFFRDLRRSGSSARKDVLSKFNLPSDASEAARLEFRRQIEAQLGLVTRSQGRSAQVAVLMDQLRAELPNATRSELRQLAEQSLRKRQTQPSLPAYQ